MQGAEDARRKMQEVSGEMTSFEGISSISKLSLPDQVFASLRDALMCGRFAPGQRLPLRSIAAALGTSTMPAREAVNRLVAVEALELLPNRRVCVPVLSADRYKEILIARDVIEPAAAEKATTQLSDEDLQALAAMYQEMRALTQGADRQRSAKDYMRLDKAFFFRIYSANQSAALMSTIESFWIRTGPYLNILLERNYGSLSGDNVKPVLDALNARNPSAVREAVSSNIRKAAAFIIDTNVLSEASQLTAETV